MLGVEGFGQYGFAIAIVGFFNVISDFGLNQVQIRETSIHKDNPHKEENITPSLIIRIILGAVSLLVIVLIALVSDKPNDVKALLILLGFSMFISNLLGSFSAVLMGLERFSAFGIISAIYSLAYAGLGILALRLGFGLWGIGISQLAVALSLTIIGALYVSMKVQRPRMRLDIGAGLGILRKAMPLGLTAVLVSIYYRADFVMLSYIRGDVEVGYYNSAYTVVNTLLLFAATLSGTLLPRFSALFAADFAVLGTIYRTAFKYLLFTGLGCAFGTMLLARPVFAFVYGPEYLPGASALAILIWASALMFVNSLQGTLLIASDMKRQLVYLTATAAGVNIALNIFLIPRFGFKGAAVATVASEVIAGTWSFVLLRRYSPPKFLLPLAAKALSASAVMVLVLSVLGSLHVLLQVAVGIAVYITALAVFKGIDASDMKIVRSILGVERPA